MEMKRWKLNQYLRKENSSTESASRAVNRCDEKRDTRHYRRSDTTVQPGLRQWTGPRFGGGNAERFTRRPPGRCDAGRP